MTGRYEEAFSRSINDPEGFWGEAAEAIHWYKKWDKVLDNSNKPFYRWFKGGIVNTCYNALDRHVEGGRADQAALIYDSPVTNTIRTYTYRELRDEVAKFAGVLEGLGVGQGRPGHHLHADDPRSADRHARLRPHRRRALGGVRRLRLERTGGAHRTMRSRR